MKAIKHENIVRALIVPGCLDANKGDQALVWQTIKIVNRIGIFNEIAIIGNPEGLAIGESQTASLGYGIVNNILPHPRRCRHQSKDKLADGIFSYLRLLSYSGMDFIKGQLMVYFAPWSRAIKILFGQNTQAGLSDIRQSSAIFVKGGGFIHSYGGLSAPYYMWYSLFYIKLAKRLKIPVIIMPNSFGPFCGLSVKWQIKNLLKSDVFVSARETISSRVLAEVLGKEIPSFPDLAYFLEIKNKEVGMAICRNYGVPVGEKLCLGITIRPYRFPGSKNAVKLYQQYLDSIKNAILYAESEDIHIVFITQVFGPSAHENDRLAIRDLIDVIGTAKYSWIDYAGNCEEIKAIYSCMDYLIGTRFHSVIFAQAAGVPSIAIAYGGNKAMGIMRDMDLEEFVIPIECAREDSVTLLLKKLILDSDIIKHKMLTWMKNAECRQNDLVSQIHKYLETVKIIKR